MKVRTLVNTSMRSLSLLARISTNELNTQIIQICILHTKQNHHPLE